MNKEEIKKLFERYRTKGILIDTNILLLYLIGLFNVKMIEQFKRTKMFVKEDFYIIKQIIEYFQFVVTTPNILTETNNLCNQLNVKNIDDFLDVFKIKIKVFSENYIKSIDGVNINEFNKLGLTDSCMLILAQEDYLVLTDDFKLSNILQSKKINVINFNHLRMFYR